MIDKNPSWEAAKELLRLIALAVVPVLISWFTSLDQTSFVISSTLILRAIDKYIHEDDTIEANGLVPF